MNAWKHGERSAEVVATRAMMADCLRLLRDGDRAIADMTRQATESLD